VHELLFAKFTPFSSPSSAPMRLTWCGQLLHDARLAGQRLQVVQHAQHVPHILRRPQLIHLHPTTQHLVAPS